MSNIITATFNGDNITQTEPVCQIDYGLGIKFEGVELPENYEVVFEADGQACTELGDSTGAPIPTAYIQTGKTIYARVFLHTGANDGYVVYTAIIPNTYAVAPSDEPTPQEASVIAQMMALMNEALEKVKSAVLVSDDGILYIDEQEN